jgi:hypothetical protein
MEGVLDIKSPNFLFGQNAHSLVIIGLLVLVSVKVGAFKK